MVLIHNVHGPWEVLRFPLRHPNGYRGRRSSRLSYQQPRRCRLVPVSRKGDCHVHLHGRRIHRTGIFNACFILDFRTYGWREIFYITGFIGIVASLFWFFLYREPGPESGANQAELDYIRQGGGLGGQTAEKQKITWSQIAELFKHRQLLGIYLGQFANTSTMFFFLTWFPTYLVMSKNLPLLKARHLRIIPYVGALIGVLLGGYWSDLMLRRGSSLSKARKLPIICGLLCSMTIMAANYFDSLNAIIAVMALAF